MGFFSNLFHKKETPAEPAPAAKPAAPAGDKIIYAPLEGEMRILSEIEDPVFSSEALGKGCAIEPSKGEVVAPFDGTVEQVAETSHAVGLMGDNGLEVLIHVGMDTVELKGKGYEPKVKVGDKYFLPAEYGACHILAERIYYTASAAAHNFRLSFNFGIAVEVCGIHTFFHILIAAYNKASSFYRYMTKGTLECISLVGRGSEIELNALLIHGRAGEGHIVFPAYKGAHLTVGGVNDRKGTAVVLAPYISFRARGFELSVASEEGSVGAEKQHTAMESTIDIFSVLFGDAHCQVYIIFSGSFGQNIDLRTGHGNAVVMEALEIFSALHCSCSDVEAESESSGVAGDEGLGEHYDVGSLLSRILN